MGQPSNEALHSSNHYHICQVWPNTPNELILIDNMDICITIEGWMWLLCQNCEGYCHFQCYVQQMNFRNEEIEVERMQIQ